MGVGRLGGRGRGDVLECFSCALGMGYFATDIYAFLHARRSVMTNFVKGIRDMVFFCIYLLDTDVFLVDGNAVIHTPLPQTLLSAS